MATLVQRAIREADVENARQYARRVHQLAAAYAAMFWISLIGIALLVWKAQLYVTLSQRSNVETLTLAFLLIFFAYLLALSFRGAQGAAYILYYATLARFSRDHTDVERRKQRALGPATSAPTVVGINMVVEKETAPGQPFTIPVVDEGGSMGDIFVDGAKMVHRQTAKDGSNTLLAYCVQQMNEVLRGRDAVAELDVVTWKSINDEEAEQYLGLIRFARNLERHLGADELWPKRVLTEDDCEELAGRMSAVCAALRNEAFLPDWEYEGQHQLPLIPQPLGLISLSRTEKRVDPLASMGCAVIIVAVLVFALALIMIVPPWVPGA